MAAERTSSGFGAQLREARERRGVSLRQIANATKISVGVLEALERNDISQLPGGIFSRAFVRSYAIEVGLDPEATIQEFIAQFPERLGDRRASDVRSGRGQRGARKRSPDGRHVPLAGRDQRAGRRRRCCTSRPLGRRSGVASAAAGRAAAPAPDAQPVAPTPPRRSRNGRDAAAAPRRRRARDDAAPPPSTPSPTPTPRRRRRRRPAIS